MNKKFDWGLFIWQIGHNVVSMLLFLAMLFCGNHVFNNTNTSWNFHLIGFIVAYSAFAYITKKEYLNP